MASGRHIGELKSRKRSYVDHVQEGTYGHVEPRGCFPNVISIHWCETVHRQVHLDGAWVAFTFRIKFAFFNAYLKMELAYQTRSFIDAII